MGFLSFQEGIGQRKRNNKVCDLTLWSFVPRVEMKKHQRKTSVQDVAQSFSVLQLVKNQKKSSKLQTNEAECGTLRQSYLV